MFVLGLAFWELCFEPPPPPVDMFRLAFRLRAVLAAIAGAEPLGSLPPPS